MRTILSTFAAAAALCVVGTTSRAAPIAVQNYNFSSPLVTGNGGYYQQPAPRLLDRESASIAADSISKTQRMADFATGLPSNYSNVQPGLSGPNYQYIAEDGQGTLYQNLGVAFQPYTTYSVDISGGHRTEFRQQYDHVRPREQQYGDHRRWPVDASCDAGFINEGALPTAHSIGPRQSARPTPRPSPSPRESLRLQAIWRSTSTALAPGVWNSAAWKSRPCSFRNRLRWSPSSASAGWASLFWRRVAAVALDSLHHLERSRIQVQVRCRSRSPSPTYTKLCHDRAAAVHVVPDT